MPMSTTPVRTALPTSKGGIAFGPPMKLSCSTPLPSAFRLFIMGSRFFTYCVFSANALTTRSVTSCAWARAGTAAASARQMVFLMGSLL